jgi:hypothetical protein
MRNSKLSVALCAAIVAVAVFGVPAARAGVLADLAVSCDTYFLKQPFQQWSDSANYVLAPEGGFERRARGWTLTGRTRLMTDNESYYANRRSDIRSLQLLAGSSATSPAMCVGLENPTVRLFARNRRAASSVLRVEVLFEDVLGNVQSLNIGLLTASSRWAATIPMPIVANLLPVLPDGNSAVAFRFSPQDSSGDWRIDDVYVDPYRRY